MTRLLLSTALWALVASTGLALALGMALPVAAGIVLGIALAGALVAFALQGRGAKGECPSG